MAEKSKSTSLVAKLVEVMEELGPIKPEGRNTHFGYDYLTEQQIMGELRGRLASRGVFLFTSVDSMSAKYADGKAGVFVEVTTIHSFVDSASGERIEVKGAGMGWDTGDKGVYKAITGATKYALIKNFMVSDMQDPEASEHAPKGDKPAGAKGHSRTKRYEEETGDGDQRVNTDLLELKAFLTEQKIPDGFLLRLLQDKKLTDGHVKTVAQIKPGVLRRCLDEKTKANLIKAWAAQQAADDTIPGTEEPASTSAGSRVDERPRNEVRTREGDQSNGNGVRTMTDDTLVPEELLEQEGYDNWREVEIHFGKDKGKVLGKLPQKSLKYWMGWKPKPYRGTWDEKDMVLDAALCLASAELGGGD